MIFIRELFSPNQFLLLWQRVRKIPGHYRNIRMICGVSLILLVSCISVCAQSSLKTPVTISAKDKTLREIFKELEQKTGFTINYQDNVIDAEKKISLDVNQKPFADVLEQLLKNTNAGYKQQGGMILLLKKVMPAAQAPKDPGKVAGRIIDEENGLPVSGATIRIGTNGATTDENGSFVINLPKGKYEAEISSIGFGTKRVIDIMIKDGEVFQLNIPLKRDKGQLSKVTVSARRYRETGTNVSLVNEIREADAVVSGVAREQISRSQDRDAAEVVRRISGVSIIQNRLVLIRGLQQRYNTVMLNNVIAPSFEPDSRAFSFDILPSGLIDRVMIYKTAMPELPGDFAGGVIKVYTTEMPVRNSFNVSYSASYNVNTTFRDFYEQEQGKKAWLGFDDGTYGMPKGAPGRIDQLTIPEKRELTPKFNDNWDPHQKTAPVDHRFSLDFGQRIALGNSMKLGVIGAFSYSNTYQYSVMAQNTAGLINEVYASGFKLVDQSFDHNVRLNSLLNLSLEINKDHRIGIKQLYTHMGSTNAILRNGETGDAASDGSGLYSGQYVRQIILSNAFRGIYTGQVSGSHKLFTTTELSWVAGYTKSRYDDPDQRYRTLKTDTGKYYNDSSLLEPLPGTQSGIYRGRRFFSLPEEIKTAAIDLKQSLKIAGTAFTVKAGVFIEDKERTFDYRQLGYLPDTETGMYITETYGKNNSYNAQNILKAAYLAFEIPVTTHLKFYGGLRIEDNQQALQTYTWQTTGTVNDGRIDLLRKNTSKLPSLNISYTFNKKNLVRAAYSKTLNRPEFREISTFFYMDMMSYRLAYGNENLKIQTDIDNYDLRFEHYPGAGEMITAGLFYKRFKNPIEFYYYAGTSGYNNFQWNNAVSADNYGAEIELMLGLGRFFNGGGAISKVLQKMSVLFNTAYIHSRVDLGPRAGIQDKGRALYGQSPFLVNAALNYTDEPKGLKLNASYNVIGKRLTAVGNLVSPNIYEMPRHALDLGFSQSIGKFVEIKGGIQNVLNARFQQIQTAEDIKKIASKTDDSIRGDNNYQSNYAGATFSLGVGLKL